MKGYYEQENSGKESVTPTGRLHVEVMNLPDFQKLITQAKEEADRLQRTIDQLSNFYIDIDFSTKKPISSEPWKQHLR